MISYFPREKKCFLHESNYQEKTASKAPTVD